MAAPWVAGAQARIIGQIHGQETVNVLHFATNSQIADQGELDTLLLELAEALLLCAIQTLLPAVTSDWTLIKCDAKRISPSTSDPIIATAPADSVGELATSNVSFASSLLSLRTGGGGKRGRGRVFLPPAGDANITNSAIDAPTLIALAAFATCLAEKFGFTNATTAWRIGVFSRKNFSGIGGSFDNSFRQATQLSPVADVAIMGSRRKGRGA